MAYHIIAVDHIGEGFGTCGVINIALINEELFEHASGNDVFTWNHAMFNENITNIFYLWYHMFGRNSIKPQLEV